MKRLLRQFPYLATIIALIAMMSVPSNSQLFAVKLVGDATGNDGGTGTITVNVSKINGVTPGGTCGANQFANSVNANAVPSCVQPSAGNISGLAASATTDTTNASNISTGTLAAARLPASSIFIGRQVITSTGTYTPTSGTNEIDVTCVGGGGAGGGAGSTTAGQSAEGAGGGAGGGARKRVTASFSGVTVTIGAGGTGVSGSAGNNGSNTTFGAAPLVQANGGTGGAGMSGSTAGATASGGTGGTGPTGDIGVPGQTGKPSIVFNIAYTVTGAGGDTPFGLGFGGHSIVGTGSSAGNPGIGYGGGGSGGGSGPSTGSSVAGGNGTAGACIVDEYR